MNLSEIFEYFDKNNASSFDKGNRFEKLIKKLYFNYYSSNYYKIHLSIYNRFLLHLYRNCYKYNLF